MNNIKTQGPRTAVLVLGTLALVAGVAGTAAAETDIGHGVGTGNRTNTAGVTTQVTDVDESPTWVVVCPTDARVVDPTPYQEGTRWLVSVRKEGNTSFATYAWSRCVLAPAADTTGIA
ncbi:MULTISPECIES: hypothetical protein [unclassified Nocardioides]|uniref:hypothetical protein n=1 Tax=unclassified Nocardioides TaxID=2615069 RepID=UPI003612E2BC